MSHMHVVRRAICAGVLAFTVISCGADSSTQTTASMNQSQTAPITDFNAFLIGGGEINLQSELQKSPVALWFWAPG